MLGCRELTLGQRIGGVFLLVLCVVASPHLVFLSPTSLAEHVWYAGSICAAFGGDTGPAVLPRAPRYATEFAAMARVCSILPARRRSLRFTVRDAACTTQQGSGACFGSANSRNPYVCVLMTFLSASPIGRRSRRRCITAARGLLYGGRSDLAPFVFEWWNTHRVISPIIGAKRDTSCFASTANLRHNSLTAAYSSSHPVSVTRLPTTRSHIGHRLEWGQNSLSSTNSASNSRWRGP